LLFNTAFSKEPAANKPAQKVTPLTTEVIVFQPGGKPVPHG